ncbi:MAG: DUF932 domain-containing protein, partial [Flavobacterium sp.]
PTRRGLQNVIISNGEIVNVVSDSYGHLPNENFFIEVERKLIEADIEFISRTINRENRSFCADYILNDARYKITLKQSNDIIQPMLRFTNSYDGSCKTSGHFGFFRKVCANGLHVAHSKIGFSAKHRGSIQKIVVPEIKYLVEKFMDNEYYSLQKKFEVLANKPIMDIEKFVKTTADELNVFKYEASAKNPTPSLNARLVINTINREKALLKEQNANLWLGYNAFNELIHGKLKKTFEQQQQLDSRIFDYVLSL